MNVLLGSQARCCSAWRTLQGAPSASNSQFLALAYGDRALTGAGACKVCLKKAGFMHDHFPNDPAAALDPSPVLSRMAAAGMHPYHPQR